MSAASMQSESRLPDLSRVIPVDEVGIMGTPLQFHTPKLPGLGDINWGQFYSVLSDSGYDGPVCIEVEDRAYEGSLEMRKASLVQSGRYLKQFMP